MIDSAEDDIQVTFLAGTDALATTMVDIDDISTITSTPIIVTADVTYPVTARTVTFSGDLGRQHSSDRHREKRRCDSMTADIDDINGDVVVVQRENV